MLKNEAKIKKILILIFFSFSFLFAYDTLWFRLGDAGFSRGVEIDPFGNIIVCGERNFNVLLLIKYSPSGEIIWSRIIHHDEDLLSLPSLAVDKEGNIIMVAGYFRYPPGEFWGYIVKCDNEGNILWFREFTINRWCWFRSVVCDDSNNIFLAGVYGEGEDDNIVLIKYSPNGDLVWTKRYDFGGLQEEMAALIQDKEGNIIGVGETGDGEIFDLLTVKFDKNGDTIWVSRIDFQPEDWGKDVAIDSSNNIYVCGDVYVWGSVVDTLYSFVVKYNQNGDTLWTRFYKNHGSSAISVDKLGNVLVAGFTKENGIYYTLLIKYSPFGDTIFSQLFNFSPDSGMWPDDMALVNDSNYIYITGTFHSGRNYNIYLMKLLYQPAIKEEVSYKVLFTSEKKAKEFYDITGKRLKDLRRIKKGVYFFKDKYFKKVIILN